MRLLSGIRHQNLVGLEGFCHEAKQQILVYEYLPGGSLANHLYGMPKLCINKSNFNSLLKKCCSLIQCCNFKRCSDVISGPKSKKVSLSWVRRLKIAVDAAKGMLVLLLLIWVFLFYFNNFV